VKQKKKIWAIALVIILLALLAGNSIAYYSVIGTATNVVTSGNIRLKIIETGADNKVVIKSDKVNYSFK
jgi:predicted ribosomally synthesized peptide with SipW-like signal peptide